MRDEPEQARSPGLGRAIEFAFALVACAALLAMCWFALWDKPSAPSDSGSAGIVETDAAPLERVSYGREIRPLLSDRCFNCHGQDPATREAGLRLDRRDEAIADRDGLRAIAPGAPDSSELWRRITALNPDERMPPPEAGKKPLSAADLESVHAWIEQGAPYEPHWAFDPPRGSAPPDVARADWVRDEIDAFTLARMEAAGVTPSAQASPEVLLRRVFLDLTGLPPTPEEVNEFLAAHNLDPDAAYEQCVTRLLTEEPYITRLAERLTLPWLDAARYADTIGIHTDAGRQMWLWRDWVIDAFRSNMPYDRFISEQIAGDLLPDATTSQIVASGFNRNHVVTDEGGAIDAEYLAEYAADRTNTTSTVFLGLTMGCARCHDHKYDPISTEEYYGLFAFFNSNDEPGLYSQEQDPNRAFEPAMAVPTAAQRERLAELNAEIERLRAHVDNPSEEVIGARDEFLAGASGAARWHTPLVIAAEAEGDVTLDVLDDRSVQATGPNPQRTTYEITTVFDRAFPGANALLIEALPARSDPDGRPGRAPNGNAVLTGLRARVQRAGDTLDLEPAWAWADSEQDIEGYAATDALTLGPSSGWGLDGHYDTGARRLLVLLDEPIDLDPSDRLLIRLAFESEYASHTFVRVRTSVGAITPPAHLEPRFGTWHTMPSFTGPATGDLYATEFGPESATRIDPTKTFGDDAHRWALAKDIKDGASFTFPGPEPQVYYAAREVFSPHAMDVPVSLGSDDGFRLYVNGAEIAGADIARGVAPDQDSAILPLRSGRNLIVMKIINTGGPGGLYFRPDPPAPGTRDLIAASLPQFATSDAITKRIADAWNRSPDSPVGAKFVRMDELRAQTEAINAEAPQTMVMRELGEPRQTYVLTRGSYEHPDMQRPVSPGVPSVLGSLPDGAPLNRLGLAEWLVSPENPLVARVAVNRFWMMLFGEGLVRTPEDFGFQGRWPTHRELLDTLAVDFREGGWDVRALLRRIVTSATYRQSSVHHDDLRESDPNNELLARYPSRRLWGEQIRDQALYQAGLLVERIGGASVKPYQPDGLWREVAMVQSNTRTFERAEGDDLYRRSIYTYWKRAAPPPAMRAFDAPTREFCTVNRATTNTPLQAFVLWNDEQFVEAARVLAQRTLAECERDNERIVRMYWRCAAASPTPEEVEILQNALDGYRERYASAPDDAAELLTVGDASIPDVLISDQPELASWTMIASTIMNMHRVTTQE